MHNQFFKTLEGTRQRHSLPIETVIDHLAFNEEGLIPVIAQDESTMEVLMLAWMNKQALQATLKTKVVTYWSRSRNEIWVKGKISGNTQWLKSMRIDCDGDAIICIVKQQGPACHTGRGSCFYLHVDEGNTRVTIN